MDEKSIKICSEVFELFKDNPKWSYLEKTRSNPDRLISKFDKNLIKYWISDTLDTIEPNYSFHRHLKYMQEMHEDISDYALDYFEKKYKEIYSDLKFNTYKKNISTHISHSIYDFQIVTSITNTSIFLDYSAGYGRNLPIFMRAKNIKYIASDSIPGSAAAFACMHNDNFVQGMKVEVDIVKELKNCYPLYLNILQLTHLPKGSIDTILFAWCFSEMDKKSALVALKNIDHLVPLMGTVIIRDNPHNHSHNIDFDKKIKRLGFALIYRDSHASMTHGITRVYRRNYENFLHKFKRILINIRYGRWYKAFW